MTDRQTMTGAEHQVFMGYRDRLLDLLTKQAEQRTPSDWTMKEIADGWFRTAPAWVFTEAETVLTEVNAIRSDRGLPVADLAAVHRVESSACGHVDYTRKYALRCAELAMGLGD